MPPARFGGDEWIVNTRYPAPRDDSPPADAPEQPREHGRPAEWRRRASSLLVFVAGMLATLTALVLFRLLVPGPQPLTTGDVNQVVAEALAASTPAPAVSALVYAAIQPSLVLIQVQGTDSVGEPSGIVSALGRTIEEPSQQYAIGGAIQTDAAINPGNSGGPLLDRQGRVIGMNTAGLSPSGANTGIGFAVPVNLIRKVVPQLIETGSYNHPYLGVRMAEVSTFAAQQQNLPSAGIMIMPSDQDTPVAEAGIEGETLLTAIDGEELTSTAHVISLLELNYSPGDVVTLDLVDIETGEQRNVEVTLGARPTVEDREQPSPFPGGPIPLP
jgi:S1-C subfamily serine protease